MLCGQFFLGEHFSRPPKLRCFPTEKLRMKLRMDLEDILAHFYGHSKLSHQ